MHYLKSFFAAIMFCPIVAFAQCPPGQSEVYINIIPDNFPDETTWKLFIDNLLVESGTSNSDTVCADTAACIRFEIYDTYGDGICCDFGQGSYTVTFQGDIIATGGEFTTQSVHESICIPDTLEIMTALQAMIGHVNNSNPLSLIEREQYHFEIIWDYADIFPLIASDVYTYIDAYESNYPVIFQNRAHVDISQLAPETRLLIAFQQFILDTQCTSDNIANVEGVVFEFSNIYPGPVAADAPRIANAVVPINGTHIHLPAAITAFDQDPAKRPTGYYVAPGEVVTISIPANLVGGGLVAQIGAHDDDLSNLNTVNRLVRISKDFPLDEINTQIASPLGGGIYIKVPEPSDLGWFDIVIDQAVKSPYFSLRTDHESSVAEWQADLANHHVEWVDMEADKYMMTLPLSHVQNLDDPTSLLTQWNDIMDAYNYLGGRPPEARSKAEYFAVDCMLPNAGAFGIGYPQIIGEPNAPFGPLNATGYYPTQVLNPNPHISGLSTTFHELGHAAAHPKLDTERETIVNLYAVYIFNVLYGVPLDEAFKHSEFQLMRLDQAAVDWMVSHNFRDNIDMSCDPILPADICDELRYQHRGHAKYVEMAKQFGWSSIHGMNAVFYEQDVINPGVWADIFKESDEMIAAASDAQGVNMAPLFHFWGLAPSPELADELAANYGFNNQLCEMLQYYKTIVPATGTDLQDWYNNLDHQNWIMDDRYEVYVAEYESANYFDSIQAQIDFLIETYGPCESVGIAEQVETNITVTPNPTDGLVNVHFRNGASATVQVMDVNGRIVFHQKNVSDPNFSFILNAVPGLYIMQVDTGSEKVFCKIVIDSRI